MNAFQTTVIASLVMLRITHVSFYIREVLALAVFAGFWVLVAYTLIAVARWANRSRRSTEGYYKMASLGKTAPLDVAGGVGAIELLREQERIANRRDRERLKVGGLITAAVGVGLMVFLRSLPSAGARQSFLVGLIPLLIGLVMLGYSLFFAAKD